MGDGYRLFWSRNALNDLQKIINYLSENWTKREVRNFARRLDKRLNLIVLNPRLFPSTSKPRRNLRRSVLTPHITIYYVTARKKITVVRLFDNRQNPANL